MKEHRPCQADPLKITEHLTLGGVDAELSAKTPQRRAGNPAPPGDRSLLEGRAMNPRSLDRSTWRSVRASRPSLGTSAPHNHKDRDRDEQHPAHPVQRGNPSFAVNKRERGLAAWVSAGTIVLHERAPFVPVGAVDTAVPRAASQLVVEEVVNYPARIAINVASSAIAKQITEMTHLR